MTGDDLAREVQARCDAQVAEAVAAERQRVRRLLAVPALNALRCIPDGEIRVGCVVHDGAQVRERLRQAYLAVRDGSPAEFVGGTSEPSTEMPARPAESHGDAPTADVGPSPCSQPSTPQNGSQAVSASLRTPSATRDPHATVPWGAFDPTHPDHDDFVRTAGRCFADPPCARHSPKEDDRG